MRNAILAYEILKSYALKYIWLHIKIYLNELFHSFTVLFFVKVISFIFPILTMILIDDVIPHAQLNTLTIIIIVMICFYLIEIISNTTADWMMFSSFTRLSASISINLFKTLFHLPLKFFSVNRTGLIVSKVLAADTLKTYLSEKPLILIMDLLFGVLFLFFLINLSPLLTIMAIITVPIDFYISYIWTQKRRYYADRSVNLMNDHGGTLVESINGIESIYQLDVKKHFFKIWISETERIVSNSIKLKIIDTKFSIIQNIIGKVSNIFIWWYGIHLIINGDLKLGQFIAFTNYIGQLTTPILSLCELWKDFQNTAIAVNKLEDIVTPESTNNTVTRLPKIIIEKGEIEIKDLVFGYYKEDAIFNKISLHIKDKEKIGIIGHSGSGKTTFVNLLQSLLKPQDGNILIDGQDISLHDSTSIRKYFGVVSQTGILFKKSIAENIALGSKFKTLNEIIESAKCAGAHDFIMKLPQGYETIIEERGSNLSAGQRQRIMIARAVIRKPKIFIFDEATAALDPKTEEEVLRNLFEIAKDKTVLMISHQDTFKQFLDRIIRIEDGKII